MSEGTSITGLPGRFLPGFVAPLRAVKYLLRHPTLLPVASLPLLANMAVLVITFFVIGPHVGGWVEHAVPKTGWWVAIYYPLKIVAYGVALLAGAIVVNLFGTIIASPFNEMLSGRVEALEERLPPGQTVSWAQTFARFGFVIVDEIKKWTLYLAVMGCLLFVLLIPVLGQVVFTLVGGCVTFWFLGYEYLDHCFGRRAMFFAQRRAFCWANRSAIIGLGMAITFASMVPLAFFFVMPLATVGATLLFLDLTAEPPKSA